MICVRTMEFAGFHRWERTTVPARLIPGVVIVNTVCFSYLFLLSKIYSLLNQIGLFWKLLDLIIKCILYIVTIAEDGGWGDWKPWANCPSPCGMKVRYRECNNPEPTGQGDCADEGRIAWQEELCQRPSSCWGNVD